LVVRGEDLGPLWRAIGVTGQADQPPLWEACESLGVGAIKITRGCPFRCTYCSVPLLAEGFSVRPLEGAMAELDLLAARGARDVAFYDDALLHQSGWALLPLLEAVAARPWRVNFHTPNALHARLLSGPLAGRMVAGGFRTFYLGLESRRDDWQQRTGGKLAAGDLEGALEHLAAAGAGPDAVAAYVLLGHPDHDAQDVAGTIAAARALGVRVMLSEFSPIPGTSDFAAAGAWTSAGEPLSHNKTAFSIRRLGFDRYNALKKLARGQGEGRGRGKPPASQGDAVR
ncbi:MAG: radical SAM protein, partial [Planctomycetota bacterium]|nr:radical SAM protein [Planctomycetota bacterium]